MLQTTLHYNEKKRKLAFALIKKKGELLIFQINMIILIFVKIDTHNFILAL